MSHTIRDETAKTLCETGARSCVGVAASHAVGDSEGGVPPSWGSYKGAGPLRRSRRGKLQGRTDDGRWFDSSRRLQTKLASTAGSLSIFRIEPAERHLNGFVFLFMIACAVGYSGFIAIEPTDKPLKCGP